MILFIHGFGSCGWGEKSLQLRRHFGLRRLIAPDLAFAPATALDQLHAICRRYPIKALIGSSLGGFYATCLNNTHCLPSVLINPVVAPARLLAAYQGVQRRWCDATDFRVDANHIETLRHLQRTQLAPAERYLVLLQEGDQTLDFRDAAAYYALKEVVSLPGGSHRFDDFGAQIGRIEGWLRAQGVDLFSAAQPTASCIASPSNRPEPEL